jgi:hypothetical protein
MCDWYPRPAGSIFGEALSPVLLTASARKTMIEPIFVLVSGLASDMFLKLVLVLVGAATPLKGPAGQQKE